MLEQRKVAGRAEKLCEKAMQHYSSFRKMPLEIRVETLANIRSTSPRPASSSEWELEDCECDTSAPSFEFPNQVDGLGLNTAVIVLPSHNSSDPCLPEHIQSTKAAVIAQTRWIDA